MPLGDGQRDAAPRTSAFRFLNASKMTYPLVCDLAAEGFPVRLTCGVLGFSAPAPHAWNKIPVSLRYLEKRVRRQRAD